MGGDFGRRMLACCWSVAVMGRDWRVIRFGAIFSPKVTKYTELHLFIPYKIQREVVATESVVSGGAIATYVKNPSGSKNQKSREGSKSHKVSWSFPEPIVNQTWITVLSQHYMGLFFNTDFLQVWNSSDKAVWWQHGGSAVSTAASKLARFDFWLGQGLSVWNFTCFPWDCMCFVFFSRKCLTPPHHWKTSTLC